MPLKTLLRPRSLPLVSALCFTAGVCRAGVDSVVTFNEVHYNPASGQTSGEWIELRNQNSVNVDLSGWRLDGGVDFVFPAGTVIPGGGYLVVAANPAALMAAAGITGVLGPFANALANDGESVTLKNINGRRMDEISYNDRQPWPVAADGSGATLAKIEELHDSASPENWRASVETGGTPGVFNFTAPDNGGIPATNGVPGALRRYYRFEGNANDTSGSGFHGTLAGGPVYAALSPPVAGSVQCLDFNGVSQYVNVPDAFHPATYTISAWVRADTIRGQSIVVRSDGNGPATSWSHQLRMTAAGRFEHYFFDGAAKAVTGVTAAVANTWYHVAAVATNGGAARLYVNGVEEGTPQNVGTLWSGGTRWLIGSNSGNGLPGGPALTYFDGKIDEVAFWHGPMDASQVGHIATGFRSPAEPAVNNLALGAAVIGGSGAYPNLPFNGGTAPNDFSALNVTDGSAGDLFGYSYWLGREGVTNEHFVLDLGGPVEISQILLRNTHNAQYNDRGTAGFRLLAAQAVDGGNQPVSPVEILSGTLTTRSGQAPIPADSFTSSNGLTPVTARYLKFEALTSSYTGHVGLNEIEVFGTRVSGGGTGRPPRLPLVINEVTPGALPGWWIELYNHGASPLTLTGCVVETSQGAGYTLPETTLAAGGFLVLDEAVTGLHPLDGDRIFLYGPGRATVLDGVLQKAQKHQLRRPPPAGGAPGEFMTAEVAADITPGAANQVTLPDAVVINEIMYHRRPQFSPYVENPEEWIELHNKSAAAVDLSGWELDEAVSFTFPPLTVIPAGGYLCVVNDLTAFAAAHPGVPAAGNFSGGLSNRGERIILRDAAGNAVDEVFYRDKEPWPVYTDGLGSSLELKNPDADNSVPESWAASDESTRSEWRNYTFTAAAATPIYSATVNPGTSATTSFHELRMGLLEEGEVLVDDVSVRDITTAPAAELMQNGAFSSPLTPVWRVLGNHDGSSIVSDAGNPVLALRASGPLLYMHNLLETSLKSGGVLVPVVNGRQYTISLRAKWLRGCPWLHTEFYYNKVAKTFLLDLPAQSGTPGAQNSTYAANTGPTFTGVIHAPAVPAANEAVTVTARVTDPQGVGAVTLRYAVNGGAFASAAMTAGAGGMYSAVIPGQASGAVTQFYLEAADGAAAPVTASWPAAGANSRALIKVNDNAAVAAKQNLRVITTAADAAQLASQVNMMSNRRRGCTIIHNEREIFYDGKIRLRGSMYSRSNPALAGESVTFPSDHLFRGTQRTVSVRRGGMNEIVVKHAINAAGGLPDNYNDVIHLISFRPDIVGAARMEMERFSNSWLDEFYPEGSDGTQFKLEGIRDPGQTFANGIFPAGHPEGFKNYTTAGMGWIVNLDLADLGTDGEQYRHAFRWLNNYSRNDNARFVELCRTLSLPVSTGPQQQAFEAAIEPLMDVDEWMRTFAMMSLFGIGDVYSQPPGTVATISNPHNLNFYMPPTPDGKISAIPWDWNFVFSLGSSAPLSGDKNIQKVIARPRFKRLFLGHFKDLVARTFNTAYLNPWLAHFGSLTGENYTGYAANIANRAAFVNAQISAQIPPVTFSISTNGGADFSTAGAAAVLQGDGWVDVREIRLNGSPESLPVVWLDENSWQLTVPLGIGLNAVTLTAFNHQGVAAGSDTINITNTSAAEGATAENTVVSEIHYHPAAGGAEFLEVMNISPVNFVDFTGCAFTAGIDYAFPAGTVLPPGARFVIPAAQFLNGTALNNGGERLTLEAPGGVIIKRFDYSDAPPWPAAADGSGPSLVLIAPQTNPDHSNGLNWRASTAAGGNPGADDALPFTGDPHDDADADGWTDLVEYALGPDPQITHAFTPQGLTFTIPRVPNADDAVITGEASTALTGWTAAELIASTETSLTFRAPAALSAESRVFLRALVTLR